MKNIKVGKFLTLKSILRESKILIAMSVLILTLVYMSLIFMPNLISDLVNTVTTKLQDTNIAQIQITSSSEDSELIDEKDEIISEIESIEGVASVTSSFILPAQLSDGKNKTNFNTIVVEEDSFKEVFKIDQFITDGDLFTDNEINQIILGSEVAGRGQIDDLRRSLEGIDIGDTVTLSIQGLEAEFNVVGIFDAEFTQVDELSYIRLTDFESLGWQYDTRPRNMNVSVPNLEDVDRIVDEINELEDYEIEAYSWEIIGGVLDDTIESFEIIGTILQTV